MKKTAVLLLILALITGLAGFKGEKKERISTDGSTSMQKAVGALGEKFTTENPHINFTFNPTGSGAGITAVLEERCDIGLSSRHLKEKEKEKGLNSTLLAHDGIAIIVNKENPVNNISKENLRKIFKGEITNWKDAGGNDGPIVLIGREAGSGTRDGFESALNIKEECLYRQELTSTGDVMTTVGNNINAIGYASIASIRDLVKIIQVDGVFPSEENIKSRKYYVTRPFLLITKEGLPLKKESQEFLDYATSEEAHEILYFAGVVPA